MEVIPDIPRLHIHIIHSQLSLRLKIDALFEGVDCLCSCHLLHHTILNNFNISNLHAECERAMWITEIWSERIIQFTFTIHSYTVSTLNSIEFYLIIDSMAPIISLDTDVKFNTHFQRISIHMVDSHSILFFLFSLSKTFWCFHCLVCSDSTHDH